MAIEAVGARRSCRERSVRRLFCVRLACRKRLVSPTVNRHALGREPRRLEIHPVRQQLFTADLRDRSASAIAIRSRPAKLLGRRTLLVVRGALADPALYRAWRCPLPRAGRWTAAASPGAPRPSSSSIQWTTGGFGEGRRAHRRAGAGQSSRPRPGKSATEVRGICARQSHHGWRLRAPMPRWTGRRRRLWAGVGRRAGRGAVARFLAANRDALIARHVDHRSARLGRTQSIVDAGRGAAVGRAHHADHGSAPI